MEFSSPSRIVRRLSIVLLLVLLIAGLLLAGCGSSGGDISSITSTTGNLSNSRGLAVDSSRNVFIADAGHHVIREANRSTGLLTSIAGTLSSHGYSGDGGLATNATLNFPQGVAMDSAGNLFIADTGNNVIRKVAASSQVISTIAGTGIAGFAGDNGAATVATLNGPLAVALDSSGTLLYIADTGNNVIRKVVLSTGVITTVAGTPGAGGFSGDGGLATSAQLNNPQSVAVDSSGNLFIADTANFVIREVSGGNITTVAGNNTAGGGCQTTTACNNGGPATSAQLNNPQAVAVDSSGKIYIADTGNNIIRKVDAGTISTVVGNGTAGFTGDGRSPTSAALLSPNALAFDSSGTLYIDDAGNLAVRTVGF